MTAPTEADVSRIARDCYREIKEDCAESYNTIVCRRHGDYLVMVARGPIVFELERKMNELLEPHKKPEG